MPLIHTLKSLYSQLANVDILMDSVHFKINIFKGASAEKAIKEPFLVS